MKATVTRPPPPTATVTLEMTEAEARILRYVMGDMIANDVFVRLQAQGRVVAYDDLVCLMHAAYAALCRPVEP